MWVGGAACVATLTAAAMLCPECGRGQDAATTQSSPGPSSHSFPMAERAIDVMVWGASGFTGRLVAEHLARSYTAPPRGVRPVRWALAGRNRQKLEGVRAELARIEPAVKATAVVVGPRAWVTARRVRSGTRPCLWDGAHCPASAHDHPPFLPQDVPIVIASLDDPAALQAAAASAKVLLTTAGPYTNIGTPVVEACVRAGTHYADLTGGLDGWRCGRGVGRPGWGWGACAWAVPPALIGACPRRPFSRPICSGDPVDAGDAAPIWGGGDPQGRQNRAQLRL